MTLHLSDYVSGGEIINTSRNSVHGFIGLHGCDRPIVLQLTGNCGPNLSGLHFRFESPGQLDPDAEPATEELLKQHRMAWIQIGVPGEMHFDQELNRLLLEWHGQNGHTVIEIVDPTMEFVHEEPADADSPQDDDLLDVVDDELDDEIPLPGEGTQIASFERTDDPESESWGGEEGTEALAGDDDPFGLFPEDLNSSLGESASSDWKPEPDEETLALWKEWDEVFDGTKDVPLSSLFDPPLQLPPPEALDDSAAADLFNKILIQLARHNVAFHMCEHYTPRMGYELLRNTILREFGTHPELPRIGYTMNFDSSEFCTECDAEFERRYSQSHPEAEVKDFDIEPDSEAEPPDDDDVPF